MIVGVLKETFPGENRVALIPSAVSELQKIGLSVCIETGAGSNAGFQDSEYVDKGAEVAANRAAVFKKAELIVQVRAGGANPPGAAQDLKLFRKGQICLGFQEPLIEKDWVSSMAKAGVTSFAIELVPRITRAQSMDALSSMANLGGYRAVILAAEHLPKIFPMMMTAAGTIVAARVFVVGAGVAGLQAIATARRLGAVVSAYDVRPAVKEQVESLGARFVEMELEADSAEDKGGYAREMDEAFYQKQREMMTRVVADSDVVITTAAIPGRKSPVLVTEEMVKGMRPRSVIVDMAAERGGNCELTVAGEVVVKHAVTLVGLTNLPSTVAYHASQTYSKNIINFLKLLFKDGELVIDREDQIIAESMMTLQGEVVNERLKEMHQL